MPASHVHLVRHGEVENPDGVLYGRLPNFALTANGRKMAEAAAELLLGDKIKLSKLVVSPLQRTRESAEPFEKLFKAKPVIDERIIEPFNFFEGKKVSLKNIALKPGLLFHFRNPLRPTWGEPYVSVVDRMNAAMLEHAESVDGGDVVFVTHQMPIWVTHLKLAGKPLPHNPSNRRCALSSVTSFEYLNGKFREIDYRDPAAKIKKTDRGAV
jgi:broad specificity phosphatase PhoE